MGDNDFPAKGFLQQYVRGYSDYSQAGTDIPARRVQNKYAQERGGPLLGSASISGVPDFRL